MSWIENIKNDLQITTGDGKKYKPSWLNATKSIDYNISEFEFPKVNGTLVYRGTPKGTKYNLDIFFQGENHLETAKDFERSAVDSRYWKLSHPFYGNINVQPTSLSFDNTKYNITQISGTVIETILDEYPKGVDVPTDIIGSKVIATTEKLLTPYSNNVAPEQAQITALKNNNKNYYAIAQKYLTANVANDYFNAFKKADSAITLAVSSTSQMISLTTAVIQAPSRFEITTKQRFSILKEQFATLKTTVENNATRAFKFMFLTHGGAIISALCETASTPLDGDYLNANDTLEINDSLLITYAEYLAFLDTLQTTNNATPDSFAPDWNAIFDLNSLVDYTVSNLLNIALTGKKEVSIINEYDSNWILLAHRFYVLDISDTNLSTFMAQNKATLNEMLIVRKNRKIIYYI